MLTKIDPRGSSLDGNQQPDPREDPRECSGWQLDWALNLNGTECFIDSSGLEIVF